MPISRRQDQREKQLLKQLEPLLHQPVQTYRNGGTYVQDGDKQIRLTGARNHSASLAGTVYYEQLLGVKVPTRFSYTQVLEQDKYIRGHDGKRIQVRRRGADGNYKVLPAGEDYFRYHSSYWTPLFPRLIIKPIKGGGGYEVIKSRSGWELRSTGRATTSDKCDSATAGRRS